MPRTSSKTTQLGVALGLVTLALVSACGGSDGGSGAAPEPKAVTDGTVTTDLSGPVTSYDPAKGSGFQDAQVAWALYDSLVVTDSNGDFIAGLASSWKTTPNSATYTLKKGVTCSDGTAVTPAVVAASVRRFLDPATAAPFLAQVTGGNNPTTVTTGADTVTVTLAKPWAGLFPGLASPFAGIICPAGLRDPNSLKTKSDGTGAFVSATQVAGSSYTFTRRTDYTWGPKYADQRNGALPKKLVMQVLTDENTRANLMATSALQIGAYTSDTWQKFKSSKSVRTATSNQTDTFLIFNEAPGHPTADKRVREAVIHAINRQGLNQVQSFGAGQLITNLGQPGYQCFDKSLGSLIPKYDTAAAGQVLKGRSLNILGTNVFAGGDANSYVLSALEAVGVKGTLQNLDNSAYVQALFSGTNQWDVAILGYGNLLSSLLAAGGFFVGQAPPNGQNLGDVGNQTAASALTAAGTASSPDGECAALSTFQKALITNGDFLPLSTVPVHVLFAGGTSGAVVKGFVQPSSIRISQK
ncbi:MAG TPA: ABC transporter substrate-binding protein [Pseudonocardiaceae bacterium]|jgi:peptide/nickel transport system substrate-binding protein|nr:ABC transporter substrate-binding protein [Pseudonocardiaceae bacterium]